MVLTGCVPDWAPEDVFSPRRLLSAEPIFMTERDSLWRITTSLCRQLEVVNSQLTEALTLRTGPAVPKGRRAAPRVTRMMRAVALDISPGATIDPEWLEPFPGFRDFTSAELQSLLQAMTRLDLAKGRLLFPDGDAGDTCFILVRGLVDVSIKVRAQRQLLGQLAPGSIFGEVSLINGEPRTTSCSIRRDAVLAELGREACERLLSSRGAVALKFLAVLNRGLIAALRSADRRLMQLNLEGSGKWSGAGVTP